MTKFDSDSIKNKIIERLNQDKNWQAITSNSAITALINSQAEASAEIARYAEYLFKESRWDTAQNESSILSMANMLGYQPKRKISATGNVIFSTDPSIHKVGSTITLDTFKKGSGTTATSDITIDKDTDFKINNIPFIVGQQSSLSTSAKWVDVLVIQGIKKSLKLTKDKVRATYSKSKLNSYIYVPFYCSNVENAGTTNTVNFLKVKVNDKEYRIVENLLLSTSEDRDCELYNDLYSRNLFYLKFRADNQSLNIMSSDFDGITIEYIESLGSKGNINSNYKNCTITVNGTTLYGINSSPLNNGQDEEDISLIKENAVSYYRDFYSIGTRENYEKAVLNMTFAINGEQNRITPSKVKVFSDENKTKTNVSFIAAGLEDLDTDLVTGTTTVEEQITSQLNKALTRLKSPQDVLNFVYPKYYHFGIKCSCKTSSDNTASVSTSIQSYLDNLWGANSDNLDFDRDFLISDTLYNIRNDNSSIVSSVSIDAIEAVTQIDWKAITREVAKTSSSITTHACHLPFSFKNIFRSKSAQTSNKFFDFTKHNYALRIDFLFRSTNNTLNNKYNKTLLFKLEDSTINPDTLFYRKSVSSLWDNATVTQSNIDMYQLLFQTSLLSDDDFTTLNTRIENGTLSQISDTETGSIKDITVYMENEYNNSKDSATGYIEIAFDSLYRILQVFSLYDSKLKNMSEFTNINLSTLQCGTESQSFKNFKTVAAQYIDISVSLLIDNTSDIILEDSDTSVNLLCIDSYDSNETDTANLSSYKKNRFITITSTFEE